MRTDNLGDVVSLPGQSGESFARDEVRSLQRSLEQLAEDPYPEHLAAIAGQIVDTLRNGGKILFCGNGGSAADSQHLAAELVGRQNFDRNAAAGLSLTVDTSALTAIANDYGYDKVFSRQVEAVGKPGDVLWAMSTSGRSANVVQAIQVARSLGLVSVAFTGRDPQQMRDADHVLAVPAVETAKIQELHITCGHIVFALVERALFAVPEPAAL